VPTKSAAAKLGARDGIKNPGEALYLRFERILRRSIDRGGLPAGTVLLEGQIAKLLGSSRAPVRQALAHLQELGLIQRFSGRGYRVGGDDDDAVRRIELSADMLGINGPDESLRRSFAWEGIYEEVERTIIQRSVFGRFRVNELELARYYKVGRTVARDVLTRLQNLGMLEKDERQRWTIVSLDRERLQSLYTVRELLEPAALRLAIGAVDRQALLDMRARLIRQFDAYPHVTATDMNELEYDLHVRLLGACPNRELLGALLRTRCTLTLSKHVLGVEMAIPEHDPFMEEHIQIFDAAIAGKPHAACEALKRHLRSSCPKVVGRLETFEEIFTPAAVGFIS
jgi:DNA-binding GntR family transcriptional regulator